MELLIVLVIMAVLVAGAVLSVGRGMKDARTRDATRVVQQYARHAKAIALLKQRPVALTIEEISEGGEFTKSRVRIDFQGDAKAGENAGGQAGGRVPVTLSGKLASELEEDGLLGSADMDGGGGGEAEDPLRAEVKEFEGIHIRAKKREEEVARSRISVFSTADLIRRKSAETVKRSSGTEEGEGGEENSETAESEFTAVFEANGRCDPFTIKVWRAGVHEDEALEIAVGRFGKVETGE